MSKDKEIGWLYEELPGLVEKGIIPEETAVKLREHYGEPDRAHSRNLIFIISAILGSILIGLGIILLFAYNWDEYSRLTRTIITFIPLIAAEIIFGYAFFRKRDSVAWMESASGFLMLMVGAAIGLTGQIYNMGGTLSELLFTWLVLSLPLIYIANSVLTFSLYMILLIWWSFTTSDMAYRWIIADDYLTTNKLTFLVLILAAVPYLWRNIDRTRFTAKGNIIGWFFAVSALLSSVNFLNFNGGLSTLFYCTCMTTLLYASGKIFYNKGHALWQKPFQVGSLVLIYVIAIMCTFDWYWRDFAHYSWFFNFENIPHRSTHLTLYLLSFVFVGLTGRILYKQIKSNAPVNYFPFLLPVIIGTGIFISHIWADFLIAIILSNLFILSYSIYYIYSGIKLDKTSLVNAGMLFLSVLIAVRFISSDAGFLLKGIVFILIGCCFLAVNYVLMKKQKRNG